MAQDQTSVLVDAVRAAVTENQRLRIVGHGSKNAWQQVSTAAEQLDLSSHTGVIDYQPTELVVTARAGTALSELNQVLAEHGQQLASEPPLLGAALVQGTLGGAVASGFSGSARPWGGSLRDAVLGVELLNGRGDVLRFGGQVMKNVAGYDVSRLQAGAWGSLGALLNISVRVQPIEAHTLTLSLAMPAEQANALTRKLAQKNLPLTAVCWAAGRLYLRLAGHKNTVTEALGSLDGSTLDADTAKEFWQQIRDQQHSFFTAPNAGQLWRVVTPPAAPLPDLADNQLMLDWQGGLRWLRVDDAEFVHDYAQKVRGWCWAVGAAMPIDALQARLMKRLKDAFDPAGVFDSALDFTRAN
jgi:glycolate oxidase FAD binding subunit